MMSFMAAPWNWIGRSSRDSTRRLGNTSCAGPASDEDSERLDELDQCVAIRLRHGAESFARSFGLSAVPENGFHDVARPAVVQQFTVPADLRQQSYTPEGPSAPFPAAGFVVIAAVGQLITHVM